MSDLTLLHDSFRRNGRVNDFLLKALTDADFALSDGQGGWTVEQHLRHMARFRVGWLWNLSRAHTGPLLDPTRKDADGDPEWRWQDSPPNGLAAAFAAGDEAALTGGSGRAGRGPRLRRPVRGGRLHVPSRPLSAAHHRA